MLKKLAKDYDLGKINGKKLEALMLKHSVHYREKEIEAQRGRAIAKFNEFIRFCFWCRKHTN